MIARYPAAAALPAPVLLGQTAWRGQPLRPGDSASVRLRLPPGRWDVSLQYAHRTGLIVDGPGLHTTLRPYFGRVGPFWPAGVLRRGGALTVRVTARPFTTLGRLLGTSPATRVPAAPGELPLNQIAFTRHGARPRVERGHRACGKWVDFYAPDPARGRG